MRIQILCVHLVVSGMPPNPMFIYGAFLDEKTAAESLQDISRIASKTCHVLTITLADARLNGLLDELATRQEIAEARPLAARFEAIDRLKLAIADYILSKRKDYGNGQETQKDDSASRSPNVPGGNIEGG